MLVQDQKDYIKLHSKRNIHHGKWIFSDEKSVKYQSSMKKICKKNDSMGTLILNGNNSQIFEILCCALLLWAFKDHIWTVDRTEPKYIHLIMSCPINPMQSLVNTTISKDYQRLRTSWTYLKPKLRVVQARKRPQILAQRYNM